MGPINQIDDGNSKLEIVGDFFLTPSRLFFGKTYHLENGVLKGPETFLTLSRVAKQIAAIALFPLSLISSLFGITLKYLALQLYPELKNRYSLPILENARTAENFSGTLPRSPWTPNCVNSQHKSIWGQLYNADPIAVPAGMANPIDRMKNVMAARNAILVEEQGSYLHYTTTVLIPTGPLKGTYIDDLDLIFDEANQCFQIRSASRKGFRDAIHLDFSQPGANKKRIEAIRSAFSNF